MPALAQRVLVATDFSEASELAIDAGRLLAAQNGASLTLLHVYTVGAGLPSGTRALAAAAQLSTTPELERRLRSELEALAERKLGSTDGITLAVKAAKGAADGICAYARKNDVDLIVVSTHGRTGLAHLLIGSVAERVVRHAPCPVLTLRARKKK